MGSVGSEVVIWFLSNGALYTLAAQLCGIDLLLIVPAADFSLLFTHTHTQLFLYRL